MPKRIYRGVLISAPEPFEAVLGAIAAACGLFIILPFDVVSPPFQQLIEVIPEWVLGFVFCIIGFWQLGFSFTSYKQKAAQHQASAMAGMGLWTFAFIATYMTDWRALAIPLYGAFVLVWLWVLLRDPDPEGAAET